MLSLHKNLEGLSSIPFGSEKSLCSIDPNRRRFTSQTRPVEDERRRLAETTIQSIWTVHCGRLLTTRSHHDEAAIRPDLLQDCSFDILP